MPNLLNPFLFSYQNAQPTSTGSPLDAPIQSGYASVPSNQPSPGTPSTPQPPQPYIPPSSPGPNFGPFPPGWGTTPTPSLPTLPSGNPIGRTNPAPPIFPSAPVGGNPIGRAPISVPTSTPSGANPLYRPTPPAPAASPSYPQPSNNPLAPKPSSFPTFTSPNSGYPGAVQTIPPGSNPLANGRPSLPAVPPPSTPKGVGFPSVPNINAKPTGGFANIPSLTPGTVGTANVPPPPTTPNSGPGNWNSGDPNNPITQMVNQHNGQLNGSSGLNIENAVSFALSGGQPDPRLAQFGHFQESADGGKFWVPNDPRVSNVGRIDMNGQEYIQLYSDNVGGPGHAIDPSKVIYDPTFGAITTFDNIQAPDNTGAWIPGTILGMGVGANVGAANGLIPGANQYGGQTLDPFTGQPVTTAPGVTQPYTPTPSAPSGPTTQGPPPTPGQTPAAPGDVPPATPPETPPVAPPNSGPPPPAAGTPPGATTLWQGIQQTWDGLKWIPGAVATAATINNLTGNPLNVGRPTIPNNTTTTPGPAPGPGDGTTPPPGGSGLPDWLTQLLGSAGGLLGNQQLLQFYQHQFNDLYSRGDYNSQYRPGQLAQLNDLLTDPSKVLNDPAYQNFRNMQLDNESRALNARGFSMSGNEEGDLLKYGTNLDFSHLNDVETQLRAAAQLGNPDQMARAGISSLPFMLGMMSNRNNDALTTLSRFFGQNGPGTQLISGLNKWLNGPDSHDANGDIEWNNIPDNLVETFTGMGAPDPTKDPQGFQQWAQQHNMPDPNSGDQFDTWLTQQVLTSQGTDQPDMFGDTGDPSSSDFWNWLFGNSGG